MYLADIAGVTGTTLSLSSMVKSTGWNWWGGDLCKVMLTGVCPQVLFHYVFLLYFPTVGYVRKLIALLHVEYSCALA